MIECIVLYLDYNNIRDGDVIRLYFPPPGLARNLAIAASNNYDVVSVKLVLPNGEETVYCKGNTVSGSARSVTDSDIPGF